MIYEMFSQAIVIAVAIIITTEYFDRTPFVRRFITNTNGELKLDDINVTIRKIGKIVYKITSKYTGNKTLEEKVDSIIKRDILK